MRTPLPLLPLLPLAQAARDNDYYYPGFVNPNTQYHMYWKDSINVLEDLDQFQSLYITYHGCVWSKYGTMYGAGEDYEEQDDDEDTFKNGCEGFGGGEYFWYMGRTQCFKANVAYSLYGVLKGDDSKMKKGSYCHAGTYINSFFTTFGVESFTGPMGLGTTTANSVCTTTQTQQGTNDFSYAQVDDDYLSDDYTFYDAAAFTSQGIGCSAKGNFVLDSYSGPFCHGRDYQETLDKLDDFNLQLQQMQCTEIYNANYNYNNDDDDRDRDRHSLRRLGEDNEDDIDFPYEFQQLPAVQILSFSKSCSVTQYPHDCPDPYGKKEKYAQNIQRALAYKTGRWRDMGTNFVKTLSWLFFVLGLTLMAAIYSTSQKDDVKAIRRQARKRRQAKKLIKLKQNPNKPQSTIERGIENCLSDVSKDDSQASRKTAKSCLGLPKLKFPKKLRFAASPNAAKDDDYRGNATDIDDDDCSVETSLAEYNQYVRKTDKAAKTKNQAQTLSQADSQPPHQVELTHILKQDKGHQQQEETQDGFVTVDSLLDKAAALIGYAPSAHVNHTKRSASPDTSDTQDEWGMVPDFDDDSLTATSGNSRVRIAVTSATKAAKKIPTKLKAILPGSPERQAKKAAKEQKKLQEQQQQEEEEQEQHQEEDSTPAPVIVDAADAVPSPTPLDTDSCNLTFTPIPVIPTSIDDNVLPNSFLDMSTQQPQDLQVANNSTLSAHPFLHDSYIESTNKTDALDAKAFEASLDDFQVLISSDEEDNLSQKSSKGSKESDAEHQSPPQSPPQSPKKEKKSLASRFSLLKPTAPNTDNAPKSPIEVKKTIYKTLAAPKSPKPWQKYRSLDAPKSPKPWEKVGLFHKNSKNVSPPQLATAPSPPVLSLAPVRRSTGSRLGFLTNPFGKHEPRIRSVDPPTSTDPPAEAVNDEKYLSDESELHVSRSRSFDLTAMVEIIEPDIPPESQKTLYCPSPPISHSSLESNGSGGKQSPK